VDAERWHTHVYVILYIQESQQRGNQLATASSAMLSAAQIELPAPPCVATQHAPSARTYVLQVLTRTSHQCVTGTNRLRHVWLVLRMLGALDAALKSIK
jgi:hypothetical protein